MKRRVPISTETEKCFVCGRDALFLLEEGACLYREAQCEYCGAGKRNSDVAHAVLKTCLGSEDGCLDTRRGDLAHLHVYNTQAFGTLHKRLRILRDYVCSEYTEGVRPGEFTDGVRCEDLTRLTFDDDTFDLVISEEVLEHVQDLDAALREVRRVLKPGGHFIFTVPYNECHRTQTRAALDKAGRVVETMPPVHHGDAVRPEGSLVFTDIGSDFPDMLAAIDMPTEDLVFGSWHSPEEVTWISDEVSYAAYRKHYREGGLFSAFRHNSHVFVSRNEKPETPGRAARRKRTNYRKLLDAHHDRLLRQYKENERLDEKVRGLDEQFEKANTYVKSLEKEREGLTRRADELGRHISALEADRKALGAQFDEASTYAKSLEAERDVLTRQAGELTEHVEQARTYAKSLEAERDVLRRQAEELAEQAGAIETDRKSLREHFEQAGTYAESLEAERDVLRQQVEELAERVRALETDGEALHGQLDEASSYARSLEIELGRQSATAGVDPHLLQQDVPDETDDETPPPGGDA